MLKKPTPADWERIHSLPYLSIPNCWEKCGGGFCCCNRHELVRFRAIPQGQQSFPMLDDEYEYLRQRGFLAPEMITSARTMSVTLAGGRTASAKMITCRQKGHCFSVENRPLICKIYPFIPVPSLDGSVAGFELGSVFDEMFHLAGLPSPCAVLEENSERSSSPSTGFPAFHSPRPARCFRKSSSRRPSSPSSKPGRRYRSTSCDITARRSSHHT